MSTTPTPELEAVAAELWRRQVVRDFGEPAPTANSFRLAPDKVRAECVEDARAALLAIRAPSRRMHAAVDDRMFSGLHPFTIMIDAILNTDGGAK